MLYTLNLHNGACQLYLNKSGRQSSEENKKIFIRINKFSKVAGYKVNMQNQLHLYNKMNNWKKTFTRTSKTRKIYG